MINDGNDSAAVMPATAGTDKTDGTDGTMSASVVREQLSVEKRLVETGVVRVRKRVHEDRVTVDTPLSGEIAQVDRVRMDRVLDGPVSVRYENDVMIVPVVEERLVTYTELVLVEEIHITRRAVVRPASQEVTVRREEIVVERLDPVSGEWRVTEIDPPTPGPGLGP